MPHTFYFFFNMDAVMILKNAISLFISFEFLVALVILDALNQWVIQAQPL